MFHGFANLWTAVELSRRVRPGKKPVPVVVAGEKVVLFRDAEGRIAALLDRCPHRGVALSLGQVKQGRIICPFHAWEFDGQGACQRVPLNPLAKCELLSATALPVREAGGLIFLYTAPVQNSASEPFVPEALLDDKTNRFYLVTTWKAHWTRAMENMLDTPHVPFVHRRTIGFAMRRRLRPESAIEMNWQKTPQGGRIEATLDGKPQVSFLDYQRPNQMTLHIPIPGKQMRIHIFCVPVGPQETRMIVVSTRDFGRFNPFSRLFDQVNRLILLEDKAIVESSSPAEIPPPGVEHSVASDRPTLQFRKYYYEKLIDSSAAPAERLVQVGMPAANP